MVTEVPGDRGHPPAAAVSLPVPTAMHLVPLWNTARWQRHGDSHSVARGQHRDTAWGRHGDSTGTRPCCGCWWPAPTSPQPRAPGPACTCPPASEVPGDRGTPRWPSPGDGLAILVGRDGICHCHRVGWHRAALCDGTVPATHGDRGGVTSTSPTWGAATIPPVPPQVSPGAPGWCQQSATPPGMR